MESHKKTKTTVNQIPSITETCKWLKTNQGKADGFTKYLEDVFQPLPDDINGKIDMYENINSPNQIYLSTKLATPSEVTNIIKDLKKK